MGHNSSNLSKLIALTLFVLSYGTQVKNSNSFSSSTLGKYIFSVCQAGMEKTLKNEILATNPNFNLAFSRPGLVTFKCSSEMPLSPLLALHSTFSRAYGLSIGSTLSTEEIIEKAKLLKEFIGNSRLRLHVWGRDEPFPACDHPNAIISARQKINQVRSTLFELGKSEDIWLPSSSCSTSNSVDLGIENKFIADDSDHVFNVVVPTGPFESEPYFLGYHIHTRNSHSPYPGGNPSVIMPPDAPSRAYLKIQEALLWSNAPIREGDVVVEVGSSPGGASLALLRRGLTVVGIDPSPHDRQHHPVVATHPQFAHLKKKVADVSVSELPSTVDWIVCDANVPPQALVPELARLCASRMSTLKGILFTVKIWEKDRAAIVPTTTAEGKGYFAGVIESVKAMGMVDIQTTHLPSNRQEIFLYGLTAMGKHRLSE